MPTFIDESGGTGPVLSAADRYFHLAAVWVPTMDDAQAFTAALAGVRSQLQLGPAHEFKFSKTHRLPEHRRAFFWVALALPFRFAVATIDKLSADWRRATAEDMHRGAAVELAASLRPLYLNRHATSPHHPPLDHIRVDRNDDGEFLRRVGTAFRGLGSAFAPQRRLIGAVRFGRSEADDMLQLADMVCGATAAEREDGKGEWYRLIAGRDVGCKYTAGNE